MQAAKRFAAEILRRDVPVISDFPIEGKLTGGLFRGDKGRIGLVISCRKSDVFEDPLILIPRILHLGIGCKRGTPKEKIRAAVLKVLEDNGIYMNAITGVSSIDVKQDEEGLLDFCRGWKLPVRFFSADELLAVEGDFSSSAFVKSTVGVDNVCERAAMLSAGENAKLIVKKTCLDGVTVAIAQEEWSVRFE
jgi:cobalt-precorrin 5A hydrolase